MQYTSTDTGMYIFGVRVPGQLSARGVGCHAVYHGSKSTVSYRRRVGGVHREAAWARKGREDERLLDSFVQHLHLRAGLTVCTTAVAVNEIRGEIIRSSYVRWYTASKQ